MNKSLEPSPTLGPTMLTADDIAAMRASLSTLAGYGAVDVESYREDVGALLDALVVANAEAATMRAWAERAAKDENANAEDARKERAAVVAWLRDNEDAWHMPTWQLADAIESGEHRREEEK